MFFSSVALEFCIWIQAGHTCGIWMMNYDEGVTLSWLLLFFFMINPRTKEISPGWYAEKSKRFHWDTVLVVNFILLYQDRIILSFHCNRIVWIGGKRRNVFNMRVRRFILQGWQQAFCTSYLSPLFSKALVEGSSWVWLTGGIELSCSKTLMAFSTLMDEFLFI